MDEVGLSVRRFARVLAKADPFGPTEESWRRMLTEYRRENEPDSEVTADRAELWARFLPGPAERYVRPRLTDRRDRRIAELEAELAAARAELDTLRRSRRESGGSR